jgi:hypothetical protein
VAHKYFVEWSAPNYKNSRNMTVIVSTKSEAISKAKKKLGSKVKTQHLHHFSAWRIRPINFK